MTDPRATGEVHGNAAQRFAETELEELEVDVVAWTATYRDPTDGSIWVMDYPHGELQADGPPRLKRQRD